VSRILLVADGGGKLGWGHAMRTLAVAQELKDRANVAVRWATSTPSAIRGLGPPCPVSEWPGPKTWATSLFVDGAFTMKPDGEPRDQTWVMVDHGTGPEGYNRICPHFGAASRGWRSGSICTGPAWMPLRRGVAFGGTADIRRNRYDKSAPVLRYNGSGDPDLGSWWFKNWSLAIVPPSVIAYECMALGIPVLLVPLPNDQPNDIVDAMVEAGVAWRYHGEGTENYIADKHTAKGMRKSLEERATLARSYIDGRGAERIADLLLEGT